MTHGMLLTTAATSCQLTARRQLRAPAAGQGTFGRGNWIYLTVRREGVFRYSADGQRFGVIEGDRLVDGETIRLSYALAEKGTLR